METLARQFLQFLEKDSKDWEDAAAFFDKIRTVTMDGQIYRGKDFADVTALEYEKGRIENTVGAVTPTPHGSHTADRRCRARDSLRR